MVTAVTTTRIRPHTGVAERVLAPGDPGRALRLAQWLIEAPKMLNHHRGLWGYTGAALSDGEPLTIQSTGTGGPSAALVVTDLAALGARRVVRVGTAVAPGRPAGAMLVAGTVEGRDGTSAALGAAAPDPDLTAALVRAGGRPVTLASVDWLEGAGAAEATDLQGAALLAAAARSGLRAAALVTPGEEGGASAEAEQALGRLALAALVADAMAGG